jgi:hypothetical protein
LPGTKFLFRVVGRPLYLKLEYTPSDCNKEDWASLRSFLACISQSQNPE